MNEDCAREIDIETENSYQTLPCCNDCAATIVRTRIPRTRKGIGTTCPVFREEIKVFFARIPGSGGFSGDNSNSLFYILLASGHVLNSINNI